MVYNKHMFLYETHLHTSEGSACGEISAADYIGYMKDRGFDGFVVTDHFFNGNSAVDRSLPWCERVLKYTEGFKKAREAAKGEDIDVIFGIEFNFDGDEYLIYGLDEAWLLENEDIMTLDRRGVYKKVHESGGIMVQAHPYRERNYLVDIKLTADICDGIEAYNASNCDNQNALAYEYAMKLKVPIIAGSDIHYFHDRPMGGILLPERVDNTVDLARAVISGKAVAVRVQGGVSTPVKDIPELTHSVSGPSVPVILT